MSRLVFSFYVEVPDNEFVDNLETNLNTKKELKENYKKLIDCKRHYANSIGADFKMVETNQNYIQHYNYFKTYLPFITTYNIINFYKIRLLYQFAQNYDEILFLDFDVVPNTKENFFEVWDLSKGIAILNNNDKVMRLDELTESNQTIRSPTSKYYNTQAMLFDQNLKTENDVVNTGIIGVNKEHLQKLNYFQDFDNMIDKMTKLKSDTSVFPKKVVSYFGYDNETLFSFKIKKNNVPVQWLDDKWHYFFDKWLFIPEDTKLIHAINKRFDIIWRNLNA